jgi:nicotinamide mononucleotide transporter
VSWQLEALAAALLLANVWLVARRSLWNYAFGIAAVSLYAWVFWEARLLAAFGLQFLFLGLNFYGLFNWRQAQGETGKVPVGRMGPREIAATGVGVVLMAGLIALVLSRGTDAAMPWWDSANTATALAAQWWQARRKVESWALWCMVNMGSTGLYATQGLWFTAATYALLLAVAVHGWREWRRASC